MNEVDRSLLSSSHNLWKICNEWWQQSKIQPIYKDVSQKVRSSCVDGTIHDLCKEPINQTNQYMVRVLCSCCKLQLLFSVILALQYFVLRLESPQNYTDGHFGMLRSCTKADCIFVFDNGDSKTRSWAALHCKVFNNILSHCLFPSLTPKRACDE